MKDTENLEALLETSKKINEEAKDYKENTATLEYETRCLKPWMIITGVFILIIFIAYVVLSLWRCGNFNIFCSKAENHLIESFKNYKMKSIILD